VGEAETKEQSGMRQSHYEPNRHPLDPSDSISMPPNEAADDHIYALVSVLYHALQGVQACGQYIEDAESAGDGELMKFFEDCRSEQAQRARRAQQLLSERSEDEEDEEDEDDEL
jgi:hypothetical protein